MTAPDNEAAWDALADAYQEHVGWPEDELTWGLRCPPESDLRVLGVADAAVLVLGCGGGQRRTGGRGATSPAGATGSGTG